VRDILGRNPHRYRPETVARIREAAVHLKYRARSRKQWVWNFCGAVLRMICEKIERPGTVLPPRTVAYKPEWRHFPPGWF